MAGEKQQVGKRQRVRLPLIGAMSNRGYDPTKDQRFVNAFPETRKVEQLENTRIYINKRPGTDELCSVSGDGVGRGFIWFNGFFITVIGNTVYKVGDTGSPITTLTTLSTSIGHVGMIYCDSAVIGDYIFLCDGTAAKIVKEDFSVVDIAAVPTPHTPTPIFIDGYVILPKGFLVYNSAVDDPTTWPTDNYLAAEMMPDTVKALARQNNQVVVFGESSTEFLYDAANAAGSPLSRNDAAVLQMGTAAPYCIYQNEKFCAFVAQSESGGRAVWLIEGFQPKKISDEFIERILDAETDMSDCRGYGFRTKGHLFFLINLKTTNRTLVYDFDEKLWHEWSSWSAINEHNVFNYDYAADNHSGKIYLLSATTGDIYYLNPDKYQDETDPITVEIRTNKYDMDTYNRKFVSSIRIVGDRYATNNSVKLAWSDDDYQTWSNEKDIELTDNFPAFQRGGSFRRRAFRIKHALNYPLRLESLEVVYDEGIS